MTFPQDPIAAVTHPNPYDYYAKLVAERPLYFDQSLGMWVASGAEAVTAALTSEHCRVRPATEPVPRALLGSPAAGIYRHLIRMNDGAGHCPFKQAASAALSSIDEGRVTELGGRWARILSEEIETFAFHLSIYVMGSLIGVPQNLLRHTALWMGDFARCLAPTSRMDPPDLIEKGKLAAGYLLELFQGLLDENATRPADGLLAGLAREAKRVGREDPEVIIANGIGFLFQPYDATAGLIGNTILALSNRLELRKRLESEPVLLRDVILEVLRYDPPVQNTRRFVVEEGIVAGQRMKAGDVILVVLAAANRDPAVNPDPDRFDIFRKSRKIFSFGVGAHACPGESLAITIAKAGVERLITSGVALASLVAEAPYRVSANARIPLLSMNARLR
jgi:cytochrome P450